MQVFNCNERNANTTHHNIIPRIVIIVVILIVINITIITIIVIIKFEM